MIHEYISRNNVQLPAFLHIDVTIRHQIAGV